MVQFQKLSALFSICLLNVSLGAPLRSPLAKQKICQSLASEFETAGVTVEGCLAGVFDVTDEKKDTIGTQERTTLLAVNVKFADKEFNVTIRKGLQVADNGKVIVGGWIYSNTESQDLGVVNIIETSHVGSSNVTKLRSNQLSAVPQSVLDWTAYGEAPDYDLTSSKYFKILKPGTTEIVGYLYEEGSESSEAGQKVLVTAKFSKEGVLIGDPSEESWGIDE